MTVTARAFAILVTLTLVGLIAAGTLVLTRDDDVLIGWLVAAIEKETGARVHYGDRPIISRSLTSVVRVPQLEIAGPGDGFRLSTEMAEIKIRLPSLLLGKLDLPAVRLGPTRLEVTQSGQLAAGEINADLWVSPFGKTPAISGKLRLADLSLTPWEGADDGTGSGPAPSGEAVFSSDPLDLGWLKSLKLDLDVEAQSLATSSSQLTSAQFALVMNRHHLAVKPARLVYPKGELNLGLEIDARRTPRVRLTARGEDLDPWRTLNIRQGRSELPVDVDLDVLLTASGVSLHELAAGAEGHVRLVVRNGRLRRSLADLLFVDVVGWTITQTTKDRYLNVDCGIADLTVNDGVLKSNAAYIEGEDIAITGDGTIDFGREQIDFVLLPKKKTALIGKADPVKLQGPLNKPTVTVLPWKAAAKTYGGLVFAPHIFLSIKAVEGLLGRLGKDDTDSPCLEYSRGKK